MDVTTEYKDLKDKVGELINDMSINDLIRNMMLNRPIVSVPYEDSLWTAEIRSISVVKPVSWLNENVTIIGIAVDILVNDEPELRLAEFKFDRTVADEELYIAFV